MGETNDKSPLLSILNCAVLYFKAIVFDEFKNGLLKVKLFCLFVLNEFNELSTLFLTAYELKSIKVPLL